MQQQLFKYINYITAYLIYYTYTQKPPGGAKEHQGQKVNDKVCSLPATRPEGKKVRRKQGFLRNTKIQPEV